MYCDFCGRNLAYNVKYCRHCGRNLKYCSGDTQPIPVIDEAILRSAKCQVNNKLPWYKAILKRQVKVRSKWWKVAHYLLSCIILMTMVYIIVRFQTIKEYQILVGIEGGVFATYIWWRL